MSDFKLWHLPTIDSPTPILTGTPLTLATWSLRDSKQACTIISFAIVYFISQCVYCFGAGIVSNFTIN